MIDNEIMKNVRCCADHYCQNCSLQGKPNCINTLFSFAWNTMYDQKAEIEGLQKHIDNDIIYVKSVKAEAIKEFAERLHEKAFPDDSIYTRMVVEVEDIDNLVKEMTE